MKNVACSNVEDVGHFGDSDMSFMPRRRICRVEHLNHACRPTTHGEGFPTRSPQRVFSICSVGQLLLLLSQSILAD